VTAGEPARSWVRAESSAPCDRRNDPPRLQRRAWRCGRLRRWRVFRIGNARHLPAQSQTDLKIIPRPHQAPTSTGAAIWMQSARGMRRRAVRRRRRSVHWARRPAARRRAATQSTQGWPTACRTPVAPTAGTPIRARACSPCRCSHWMRFATPAANGETGGMRETRLPPAPSCAQHAQRAGASCAIASRTKPSSVSSVHESFVSAGSFISAWRNLACVAGSWPA